MKVSELIYHNNLEYNGHKQLDLVGVFITLDDALTMCRELEELSGGDYLLEVHPDYSASIYAMNYWHSGEHPLGHTNKLMVSFNLKEG